jgi:2-keto-4-pentenoate hydratase/2-oxohepta-3-ene-1,7-dioic acid hydratase in catechol pathway
MRIARVELPDGALTYGTVTGEWFQPVAGSPFDRGLDQQLVPQGAAAPLAELRLLAPCQPSKIVCIGRNYVEHAAEHGAEVPKEPLVFLKPPSAVIGPDQAIVHTRLSQQVEHEAELVAVVGSQARYLTRDNALSCLLGFTCGNDVTARDLQRRDGQWSRAKGFDTFCPLGPWIETDLDPADQVVTCHVNGQVRQQGRTRDMVFDVAALLVYVTAVMTLEPGDVLMTGTPSGVSPLRPGDVVEVLISGLGSLRNPVIASA